MSIESNAKNNVAFLQKMHRFCGTLLTDGYAAYSKLPGVTHAGCMAHARRKFEESLDTSPAIAAQAIALIGKLYEIENECKLLDDDARRAVRCRRSNKILLRLRLYLEQKQSDVTPQSKIGKAVGYALNQWPRLCRFVDDGRLPIGRVEKCRGGLGAAYLFPALSFAGASLASPCSVSTSRSSNRTCRFPASGSLSGHQVFAFSTAARLVGSWYSPSV